MEITRENIEKTLQVAENFQNDCHKTVELIMNEKKDCSYQDATNVWLFKKLADFEMRLRSIEDGQ